MQQKRRMKMAKIIEVTGFESESENMTMQVKQLTCYVSNDKKGKTISISNGEKMFTIPFKPLEKYLK